MEDIESTWLPIEWEPKEWFARVPPISLNHSLKFGLVARSRIQALEQSGKHFDAAFFNHILTTPFLKRFRKRVPSLDAMDVTPAQLLRDGQAYYENPRNNQIQPILEIKRKLTQSVLRTATYFLPQSNYVRESLLHDYELPDERIKVITPGVDIGYWSRKALANNGRKKSNTLNVLFVGGDFHRKGGDILVRIAAREDFCYCHFNFVTKNYKGDVLPNITVHSQIKTNSPELWNLYNDADVFVLPTRADFAPTNSICEAMAMGLPVISTGVGGIDENVIDGKTGFIIPIDDEDSLIQKLSLLKNNVDLRLQLGQNARTLSESKFNLETNAHMIINYMKMATAQTKKDRG
jgi:glycosyltransferase involved in cell wall biosynthesis